MPAHLKPAEQTGRRRWPWIVVGVVTVLAIGAATAMVALGGGSDEPPPPEPAAAAYLSAWSEGAHAAMADLVTDPPEQFAARHQAVIDDLQVSRARYELGRVVLGGTDERVARAAFTAELVLLGLGTWTYEGSLDLRLVEPGEGAPEGSEDRWLVEWTPASIHPELTEATRLGRTRERAPRAPILGAGGVTLIGGQDAVTVGIEPRRMQDREEVKAALAQHLQVDPATVDERLDAPSVEPDHFVPIITVPTDQYEAVKPEIYPVPGLVFRDESVRGPDLPGLGATLLGSVGEITAEQLEELGPAYVEGDVVGRAGLEARYEEQLGGLASGNVQLVDAEGTQIEVLHRFPGRAPEPLQTTIDPAVQAAAEAALEGVGGNAALAALAPTGEVLAVATRPTPGFNRAIAGTYPPGSTFKIVTGAALLRHGVTPDTTVECPPTVNVGGRSFRNFEGGSAGTISFSDAFARSCNTAFIGAAEDLPDGALAEAAASFGFGADYELGVGTGDVAFPALEGDTERAAAAIGQARVTVTPVHLASLAAAVRSGSWRPPVLLPEAAPQDQSLVQPIEPSVVETLRALMAGVVQRGTGTAAQPAEFGKTGTAEHGTGDPPATHGLFAGCRGEVCVAVVVEGGPSGGQVAAPVVGRFFTLVG